MTTVSETSRQSLGAVRQQLDQVRSRISRSWYRAKHRGIAFPLLHLQRLMRLVVSGQAEAPSPRALALLEERWEALLEADLQNAEQGLYPPELLFQFPAGSYLRVLPEALLDVPRVIRRIMRQDFRDLPAAVDLERYPPYFRRTFHWQTDGYLSEHSARIYDASVEFVFAGTADIMRRMAIPPVVEALRGDARPLVLDLGCGTGRYLLQLHRALPQARLYGLDLSPFYLKQAREVLSEVVDVSLLAENAERAPLKDGAFDAVTSIFLFHELPAGARRNVVREARRLLRPGGRFTVCDSVQLSDSEELGYFLRGFPDAYHEPYYTGYLRDDLAALFEECGLEVESAQPHFMSKVVVGRRP